jgi:iron(III) transport system permease protein
MSIATSGSDEARGRSVRPGSTPARRRASQLTLLAFVVVTGYLVLLPLFRLQQQAFADGAAGYTAAFTADRIGRTLGYTAALALGSLAIAMVLGVALAWAATRLSPRLGFLRLLPILPIVVPAIASVVGWGFLLSPRPGYLNAALRLLPWWSDLTEGPVDVYTIPWIILLTGFGLTSFVKSRARRSGASSSR